MNQTKDLILNPNAFKHHVDGFARYDDEVFVNAIPNADAWNFLSKNIPFFDCPDERLTSTYYFRWWTFRKHLRQTDQGWVITEFGPEVSWSDESNVISCAAGHHIYEARWLHNQAIAYEYAKHFRTRHFKEECQGHAYSFWAADAVYARYLVNQNQDELISLLDDLIGNWQRWDRTHRTEHEILFSQRDDHDGMELAIGGHGLRPTINSYMYADALAISRIARLAGKDDIAEEYAAAAAAVKDAVQRLLWNSELAFFTILKPETSTLPGVRELIGYVPWYFNLPDPGYETAWSQLVDPNGFKAPYGPTTTEQRHPGYQVLYPHGHVCRWDGPSWPYATTQTLVALANLLNNYEQDTLDCRDYLETLRTYAGSHRKRLLEWPVPQSSSDPAMGVFTWESDGPVWAEYRFDSPVELDQCRIYWAQLPQVDCCFEYWNDGEWSPVSTNYSPHELDQYNTISFDPISTDRIRIIGQGDLAIIDWRVSGDGIDLAHAATVSCSPSEVAEKKLAFLNDSSVHEHSVKTSPNWDEALYEDGFEVPWIDENLDPHTGEWVSRHLLRRHRWTVPRGGRERGKDYNHSGFADLIITGLIGLRPRADDTLEVNPLVPQDQWDYFCLDNVHYHGHGLAVVWDRTGEKYGRGKGLMIFADGKLLAQSTELTRIETKLNH